MQLAGKKAIITGGASNIGRATARAYAEQGASVVILDIQDDRGAQAASEINQTEGGKAKYFHCDVSKSQEVKNVIMQSIDHLGGIDILAAVAGGTAFFTHPQDITEEQLDRILGINLKGTIFCNQAVYQAMKECGGGAIINFGSSAGLVPIGVADYGAAKGGIIAWTRHCAKAWGPDNIRVNTVCPSAQGRDPNPTSTTNRSKLDDAELKAFQEHAKRILESKALRRAGNTDEDLVPTMVFLASEAARYMTGQLFIVDGGYVMSR